MLSLHFGNGWENGNGRAGKGMVGEWLGELSWERLAEQLGGEGGMFRKARESLREGVCSFREKVKLVREGSRESLREGVCSFWEWLEVTSR